MSFLWRELLRSTTRSPSNGRQPAAPTLAVPYTMMKRFIVTCSIAFLTLFPENAETFAISRSISYSRHTSLFRMAASDDDDEMDDTNENQGSSSTNVLGTSLTPCCTNVRDTGIGTGFYRNGFCSTGEQDLGRHTVCVEVTDDFLEFSKSVGNDLSTPAPQFMFPGLKGGDVWCLCAQRWAQAYNAGKAPKLFLQATHEKTLDHVPFEVLRMFAIDIEEADEALNDLNEQRERLNKLL